MDLVKSKKDLFIAIKNNNIEIVKLLLKIGTDVNEGEYLLEAIDNNNMDDLHDISLVLEIREELDSTSDPKVLQEIRAENDEKIRNCCEELAEILKFDGDANNAGLILDRAKRCINKLRYWISIDRQLKEKEQ